MKEFFRRLLGVEALRAQVRLLRQELAELKAENDRIQVKLSGLGRYEKLDFSRSQAAGILKIMDDFKARRFGGVR